MTDSKVITIALIQLIEMYTYNQDFDYCKVTIGYNMKLPSNY